MYLHVKVSLELFIARFRKRKLKETLVSWIMLAVIISSNVLFSALKKSLLLSSGKISARMIARCGSDTVGL